MDLALIQLRKVLSVNPTFLRAHQLLALLHMHNEDWDLSLIHSWKECGSRNPVKWFR